MPVVRGQNAEFLAPGLNMRTFNKYREKPEMYRQINNVQTSSKAYEEDFAYSGFGPLREKAELESTIMDEPFKLGGVRYIHRTFALGFEISEEMRDDDQYNLMMDLAGDLGKSSRHTAELFGHDVYNNAFPGGAYLGRDGLTLCSLVHPVPGTGGTIANTPAAPVDLAQAPLEVAWANFQLQVDDRGIPIDIQPAVLLVHPMDFLLARRLLESSALNFYGPNPNEINPLQGWVRVVASPYLTDNDAWFLIAEPSELDVRFWWRKTPDTRTWDDEDAGAVIHKISQRHSVGFGDWRGVYGSPGI
jgi:phage major head subunit gpT-like protein